MRTIDLGNNITVVIKKSTRSRRMRIVLYSSAKVVLTLPFFVSYARGVSFLEEKRSWIEEKIQNYSSKQKSFLLRGSDEEYHICKNEAKKLIENRLKYYQKIYQVSFRKVSIRNQSARWGSCSSKGNLSFSYKLFLLPPRFCDYVIVHELCHLKEMNHSQNFWSLVAITFPDYKKLRREMRVL